MVVGGVREADPGNGSPCEEGGGGDRDAGEEKAFESGDDGGVLDLDPAEVERGPDANEEVRLGG